MNRVFISLYLVIVASLIFLGWAVEKIYQNYAVENPLTELEIAFIHTLSSRTDVCHLQSQKMTITCLADDSFSGEQFLSQLKDDVPNILYLSPTHTRIYHYDEAREHVVQFDITNQASAQPHFYWVLLVAFYLMMAVVIFLWVWPLTRDLNRLRKQTFKKDAQGVPLPVAMSKRSAIYDVAQAYNQMVVRICDLIASHKEMTSAVSHELRTPLSRMRFALEMPATTPLQWQQINKNIGTDIDEMNNLIRSLLSYAGLEQHSQSLEFLRGDVLALVANIVDGVKQKESTKGLSIRVHNQRSQTTCDAEWCLMERAITNVVENAARFAKTQVDITLSQNDDSVSVVVDDDGVGIPKEETEAVFNAFVRLPGQDAKSGFGLGLAIVARIMRWHAGSACAQASPLGGARIKLEWPNSQ